MGASNSKELGGFRVCNYGETSLGKLLGLERYFDYIVGIDGVPLTQISDASHDFFVKRLKGVARSKLKISVYNSLSSKIRTFVLIPSNTSIDAVNKARTEDVKHLVCDENKTEKQGNESDGIRLKLNHNIPFETQKVFQFVNFDERITGFGIGVHWEEISKNGVKVVNVQNSSPAQVSGIIPNDDYIIGSNSLKRPFYSTDDFLNFIKNNNGSQVSLSVYNSETELLREISITPDSSWGGRGLLGCDIAAGPMVDIPFRRKPSMGKHERELVTVSTDTDKKNADLSVFNMNSPTKPEYIFACFDEISNRINYELKDFAKNTADVEKDDLKEDFDESIRESEVEFNEVNCYNGKQDAEVEDYTNLETQELRVETNNEPTLKNDEIRDPYGDSHFAGNIIIRDNSFDLFQIKQTNNLTQDKREIIQKAITDDFKNIDEDLDDPNVNGSTKNSGGYIEKELIIPEGFMNKNNSELSNTQENITLESFCEEKDKNEEQEMTYGLVIQNQNEIKGEIQTQSQFFGEVTTPIESEKCSEEGVDESQSETNDTKKVSQDATCSTDNKINVGCVNMSEYSYGSKAKNNDNPTNENMHAYTRVNPTNEYTEIKGEECKQVSSETSELSEEYIKEYENKENDLETDTPGQVLTPVSEREYEIFKKLIEIMPVLDYDPPGTLEISEETEKD
ncbi:hypothetical protein FG386_002046 [Cryptosporidium ryanae]|uniref:uncharacterized protein n=1 Tax=Cryptosporidium ryanae TaxID=515981 RepID=UPI00351A6309|nr:hypothetical protein FG386_002046 [Cryptosporidium ryanae]